MKSQVILVPDAKEAGAVVWWVLSGDASYAKLSEAWAAAGLPPELFRDSAKEATALNRAVKSLAEPRRLIRPLKKKGEWAVVDEQAYEEGLDHAVIAEVRLAGDRPEVRPHPHLDHATGDAIAARVRDRYDYYLETFTSTDMSGLLCKAAMALDGLALRDHGGMYFVPRGRIEEWRTIAATVRGATNHDVFELASMTTGEAVRAILASLQREAGDLVGELEEELVESDLGARALVNREAVVRSMVDKVRGYEELLGVSIEDLRGKLSALEGSIAAAILAVSNADEEEAA